MAVFLATPIIIMYDSVRVICLSNLFLATFFQNAQKHIDRKPQSKDLRLTHGFVARGERGRAMHAGKVLCAQSSLVKVYGPAPDPLVKRRVFICRKAFKRARKEAKTARREMK